MNKKGDIGYYIRMWNENTAVYEPCCVYSCGKKKMILMSNDGRCLGMNFNPSLKIDYENPQKSALEMAREEMAAEIKRCKNRLEQFNNAGESYKKTMISRIESISKMTPQSKTYEEAMKPYRK